ncbi:glycosyltransferase [Cellulomonas xiejunii]|uniref:Glycosyltransferase family 2 protein n=1 Tax=Cellulomonas xiejunii TaxID=2968083 RepID=A0ABY5KSE2_9CELL|nr:glycosyltransferase family 2 protein [Cellulomonas xiejunii]MCC2322334.1 glycosyltransferase family 2 protein [Cellulomonas xiejunii]UUI72386.1 glycosyltransferase family 2 protein [Cellulomonas xiejunii]
MTPRHPDAVYVLPLRSATPLDAEALAYLRGLVRELAVVVVDGSPEPVGAANARALPDDVRHVDAPAPQPGCNGKVLGVRRGLEVSDAPSVVVADDDVRWERATLDRALAMLDHADLVRPQNVFDPRPWHARWDTGRSLLNRAVGGDWPGTLVVRRTALPPHGYAADVLFENLELVRTVRARGGRERVARDLLVRRRPPTVRHFWRQRVRQAYDSHAQPGRLLVELAVVPLLVAASLRGRCRRTAAAVAAASVLLAEVGRRRGGGARAYPASAALWAPVWLGERAVCAWLALGYRAAGGVPYAGVRLRAAATPRRRLRRAVGLAA